jgi:sugar phosphate isomerase/epimerase
MMHTVLGAQLYTVRDFTQTLPGIADSLHKVAAIGYKAVQVSGFGPVDPADVQRLAAENDLIVAATHMPWDSFRNNLAEVIAIHKLWGCAHAAIGGLPQEYYSLEGLDRFLDELQPVAAGLLAEGIDFSYHNHNHELVRFGEKTWLAHLYDRADPALLKAELDVYWIQAGGGDPAAWVRRCAGRQPLLHLKDMAMAPGREQRMAEIGEGNLNWPAILAAAAESGVAWYLVEQDHCYGRDPFESLAISYRNLKAMGLS